MTIAAAALVTIIVSMTTDHHDIAAELRRIIDGSGARIAVAVEHLDTGERILIDERDQFHAASTMKTPVMIEVFRQASTGKFGLDDSIEIRNEFRSIVDSSAFSMDLGEDSDDIVYARVGGKMSIRELVYQMITVSSNFATNVLIDLVDARKVTRTMRELGAADIKVLRGVEDLKAFRAGLNNETNAFDLMVILKAIATGRAVDADASHQMREILLDQRFRNKIPARLPDGTRVAHKTGSITGVEHDSGIVYMPDGSSYVLVLLSDGWKDHTAGQAVLADISLRIYEHFSEGR